MSLLLQGLNLFVQLLDPSFIVEYRKLQVFYLPLTFFHTSDGLCVFLLGLQDSVPLRGQVGHQLLLLPFEFPYFFLQFLHRARHPCLLFPVFFPFLAGMTQILDRAIVAAVGSA